MRHCEAFGWHCDDSPNSMRNLVAHVTDGVVWNSGSWVAVLWVTKRSSRSSKPMTEWTGICSNSSICCISSQSSLLDRPYIEQRIEDHIQIAVNRWVRNGNAFTKHINLTDWYTRSSWIVCTGTYNANLGITNVLASLTGHRFQNDEFWSNSDAVRSARGHHLPANPLCARSQQWMGKSHPIIRSA